MWVTDASMIGQGWEAVVYDAADEIVQMRQGD